MWRNVHAKAPGVWRRCHSKSLIGNYTVQNLRAVR